MSARQAIADLGVARRHLTRLLDSPNEYTANGAVFRLLVFEIAESIARCVLTLQAMEDKNGD